MIARTATDAGTILSTRCRDGAFINDDIAAKHIIAATDSRS